MTHSRDDGTVPMGSINGVPIFGYPPGVLSGEVAPAPRSLEIVPVDPESTRSVVVRLTDTRATIRPPMQ